MLALFVPGIALANDDGSVSVPPPPPPGKPNAQEAPTTKSRTARVRRDGKALAPDRAPKAVKQMIAAANRISRRPYRWGGGHRRWWDRGYDCSGAVSYTLYGGGLLDSPLDSRGFMRWGDRGPGEWVSIYANRGHAFIIIAGLRFDTGFHSGKSGPRWSKVRRPLGGFRVRHPVGL